MYRGEQLVIGQGRVGRKLFGLILVLSFAAQVLFSLPAQAQDSVVLEREYRIKAAFLYNFLQFVDWPEGSLPGEDQPFIVAIIGSNPFGDYIFDMEERMVRGHPLKLIVVQPDASNIECHAAFIASNGRRQQLDDLIQKLKSDHVLLISDAPNFIEAGGMIQFFRSRGRIGFEINICAAKEARLQISSRLLKLAKISDEDAP